MPQRGRTLKIALLAVALAAVFGVSQFLLWIDKLQAAAGQ